MCSCRFSVTYVHDVRVGPALVRLVVFCVFEQDFIHVGAGVLEQLVGAVEDDEGDLTVAQHAQLVRFLHQAELTLGERHLEGRNRKKSLLVDLKLITVYTSHSFGALLIIYGSYYIF